MLTSENWGFATELPPIENNGISSHSVAWSISQALKDGSPLVLTRRFNRKICPGEISRTINVDIYFYKDFSWIGLRRFSETTRFCLDLLLFVLSLPKLKAICREKRITRILAYPFNHWSFLVNAWLYKKVLRLPVDVYLVDDLEASAVMRGKKIRAKITEIVERLLLKRFDRLFLISPGYVEHLEKKYGVTGEWLPVVVRVDTCKYNPLPKNGTIRWISFLGSFNELYLEPLKTLVRTLAELNPRSSVPFGLRLFSTNRPVDVTPFQHQDVPLDFRIGLSNDEVITGLGESYANFLPYSFESSLRVMVTTAFSCKIAEYLAAGRPILVYGPHYASIPRYFRENDIPLVAESPQMLAQAILEISNRDAPELIAKYDNLLKKNHSPQAFLERINEIKPAMGRP